MVSIGVVVLVVDIIIIVVVSRRGKLPEMFDADGLEVTQGSATSADGTEVPYFMIKRAGNDGPVPTLLYGCACQARMVPYMHTMPCMHTTACLPRTAAPRSFNPTP